MATWEATGPRSSGPKKTSLIQFQENFLLEKDSLKLSTQDEDYVLESMEELFKD